MSEKVSTPYLLTACGAVASAILPAKLAEIQNASNEVRKANEINISATVYFSERQAILRQEYNEIIVKHLYLQSVPFLS